MSDRERLPVNPHDWRCMFTNLTEGDHCFVVQTKTIGDYGVVNGTATYHWLACESCGLEVAAGPHDLDDYYDDYFY